MNHSVVVIVINPIVDRWKPTDGREDSDAANQSVQSQHCAVSRLFGKLNSACVLIALAMAFNTGMNWQCILALKQTMLFNSKL